VSRIADCRRRAAECLALAQQARDSAEWLFFLDLSARWRDLANTIAIYIEEKPEEEMPFGRMDDPTAAR
jgi:hypothetical protein